MSSSFVDVLPTEPVTAITDAPSARRHSRASVPMAASGSAAVSTAPPPRQRTRARRGMSQAPASSAPCGEAGRRRCSPPRARRTGRPAPAARESIDTRAARCRRAKLGSRCSGDALSVPAPHAGATERSASRAMVTSSNGSLRPPSNSWPCSCPCRRSRRRHPARRARRRGDAARRSDRSHVRRAAGAGEDLGDDRRRVLGARVVEVTRRRRPPRADAPISGRLPRSRSPPRRRRRSRGRRPSSRAARSTFSSESGVCA